MNLIVKRFFVLALPLLMAGSLVDDGYSIRVENESGIELDKISINDQYSEFTFGDLPAGEQTGLGNADLQFGEQMPEKLNIAFTPKNGKEVVNSTIEIPCLGESRCVKLTINSYLDLIDKSNLNRS
ncbi:hypothetical protein N9Y42_07480 [Mariniblastus sp.]|nr:hypothetical protein [Mariniblastus sp.]